MTLRLLSFLLLMQSLFVSAQEKDCCFNMSGRMYKDDETKQSEYVGASIHIYVDGSEVQTIKSERKGRFSYGLDFDKQYEIVFGDIESGYVPKRLFVDTRFVPNNQRSKVKSLDFSIQLIEHDPLVDFSVLNRPMGKIIYNKKSQQFDYDREYSQEIKKEVNQLYEQLEERKKNCCVFVSGVIKTPNTSSKKNKSIALEKVPVSLYLKGYEVSKTKSDASGNFAFNLEFNKLGYSMIIGNPDGEFESKKVLINTIGIPEESIDSEKDYDLELPITLRLSSFQSNEAEVAASVDYDLEDDKFIIDESAGTGLSSEKRRVTEVADQSSTFDQIMQRELQMATEKEYEAQIASLKQNIAQQQTKLGEKDLALLDAREAHKQAINALDSNWAGKHAQLLTEIEQINDQTSLDAARRRLEIDKLKAMTAEDSLAIQEREAALNSAQNKLQQARSTIIEKDEVIQVKELETQEQRRRLLFALIAISLIMVLAGFLLVSIRRQVRANKTILQQRDEITGQKIEVEKQKELIEEKSQEIMDSIQYAKRIQTAILPPDRIVKEYLKESFVLYKPKDVVAGDFYWMETVDDVVYFAAADCTGHGVPGAMVSVICNNGLNRSLREFDLREPGHILDKTRELVIKEFEKSEEEVKDGMDISLCALNTQTRELRWAGANNPLWIATSRQLSAVSEDADSLSLHEVKADKQPIGKYGLETPFTTHAIQLNEGDTIYIFSDGFPDQFGGEKGKKYKSGNFKKTLIALAEKPMSEQKQLLDSEFETWRGDIEQIDDVCVIGVKV